MLPSQILAVLESQTANQWLVNHDSVDLFNSTQELISLFTDFSKKYHHKPTILLTREEPSSFIAAFLAAIALECPICLGHPWWHKSDLEKAIKIIKPDLILDRSSQIIEQEQLNSKDHPTNLIKSDGIIGIPTGGSSGRIRFAVHTLATLTASAQSFAQYFSTAIINSFCTLPLHHVSGLMQLWRSFITQGKLAIASNDELKQTPLPGDYHSFFISLVPTQLQFLLENNQENWLRSFQTILLGGAPTGLALLTQARKKQLPIALTYGMSETAAGISYLHPNDFLAGNNSSGKILDHAEVKILNPTEKIGLNEKIGTIQIRADSLFQGYVQDHCPNFVLQTTPFVSDDLGYVDGSGYLHIFGRKGRKIISGGENIYPSEVEAAILATKLVEDVCVVGIDDEKWGEAVTALCVLKDADTNLATIQQQLAAKISKYKQPKYWFVLSSLPRNPQGKFNYSHLTLLAQNLLINPQQQV